MPQLIQYRYCHDSIVDFAKSPLKIPDKWRDGARAFLWIRGTQQLHCISKFFCLNPKTVYGLEIIDIAWKGVVESVDSIT
jgi:hypothetical protein